jgi:hypothetical protein
MTIGNILAIRNLMPGDEPEIKFFRPGEEPKIYKFRDKADREAAQAEAQALIERLFEKHDWDEKASGEEFLQMCKANPRLRRAALSSVFDHLIETDPVLKRHFAKQERNERARLKRAAKKKADEEEAEFIEDPKGDKTTGDVVLVTEEELKERDKDIIK